MLRKAFLFMLIMGISWSIFADTRSGVAIRGSIPEAGSTMPNNGNVNVKKRVVHPSYQDGTIVIKQTTTSTPSRQRVQGLDPF